MFISDLVNDFEEMSDCQTHEYISDDKRNTCIGIGVKNIPYPYPYTKFPGILIHIYVLIKIEKENYFLTN